MRRTVQKAWQAWCGKAGEPDCGGGGTPTQAEHLRRGAAAEALAAAHLESHGLAILVRNLRCRGGEVDLIARDRNSIVFVEVRLRSNPRFGGAAASITATKQQRVILAARYWLAGAGRAYANAPCRFDAVLLEGLDPPRIEWLRGAFDAG